MPERFEPTHRLGGYREHRPPPDLAEVVGVVWTYARPARPGTPRAAPGHRVLHEPGVSLVFRCLRDREGRVREPDVVFHGPVLTPRLFRPPPGLHLAGVRLKPEWARELLEIDPREHGDAERPLGDVAPRRARRLLDLLSATRSSREAIGILVDELRAAVAAARPSRSALLAHAALERIRGPRRGELDFGGLAGELGVSSRHLRRVIRECTGLGPKRMQRILRLESAVFEADRLERPPWARLAVAAGFYDQAHLIQEFRDLTARTPVELHVERRAQRALHRER